MYTNIKIANYDSPTPVQRWAIPMMMQGRNFVASAVTGSGKTAAYLIPILSRMMTDRRNGNDRNVIDGVRRPSTLILVPTRELAMQIWYEIHKFGKGNDVFSIIFSISQLHFVDTGVSAVTLYGGTGFIEQAQSLSRSIDIIVACPGRLVHCLEEGRVSFVLRKSLILC